MKKILSNYFIIFLITYICSYIFNVSFDDYIATKYFFPNKSIYIAISILLNYFYIKIIFNCIELYIRMNTLIVPRIGRNNFNKKLIIDIVKCFSIFLLLSIIFDFILYGRYYFKAILITTILEILIGLLMIKSFKRLRSNLVLISLIIIIILRWICFH